MQFSHPPVSHMLNLLTSFNDILESRLIVMKGFIHENLSIVFPLNEQRVRDSNRI